MPSFVSSSCTLISTFQKGLLNSGFCTLILDFKYGNFVLFHIPSTYWDIGQYVKKDSIFGNEGA